MLAKVTGTGSGVVHVQVSGFVLGDMYSIDCLASVLSRPGRTSLVTLKQIDLLWASRPVATIEELLGAEWPAMRALKDAIVACNEVQEAMRCAAR